MDKEFIGRLRSLIEPRKQGEFAESIGVTDGALSNVLSGKNSFKVDVLTKICEKCSVSLDWLVRGVRSLDRDREAGEPFEVRPGKRNAVRIQEVVSSRPTATEPDLSTALNVVHRA